MITARYTVKILDIVNSNTFNTTLIRSPAGKRLTSVCPFSLLELIVLQNKLAVLPLKSQTEHP